MLPNLMQSIEFKSFFALLVQYTINGLGVKDGCKNHFLYQLSASFVTAILQ